MEGGKRPILRRQGGKYNLYKKIIPKFPDNYENYTYVEPFIGGGSIFFNKEPSHKEVINDLDKNIYLLLKTVKNNHIAFENRINGEYNREDFSKIMDFKPTTDMGKTVQFFLLTRLSYLGTRALFDNSKGEISTINKDFSEQAERLKYTTILNKDYAKVIAEYDSPNTFFYLDPPYEGSSKSISDYKDISLEELRNILLNIKGKFLMSLNNSQTTRKLFSMFHISKITTKYSLTTQRDKIVYELLISNY